MLRMLRYRIDQPSSRSFSAHSLYISDTQGKTRWEGSSSPSLCPADHSAGILHSHLRLTAAGDYMGWGGGITNINEKASREAENRPLKIAWIKDKE